jgi:hypothetical protein
MHSTRDPFSIRSKSPLALSAFSLLQSAAAKTAHGSSQALASTKQVVEATRQAIHDTDMSFAVPRNVPSLETAQRRFEENVWSKVTGNEKGLPMYKDKPSGKSYGYGVRTRKGLLRSRRGAGLLAVVLFGLLYWFGWRSTPADLNSAGGKAADKAQSWTGLVSGHGKGGSKVDWEKRKEAVRDAFLLSWGAYKEHKWGMSFHER